MFYGSNLTGVLLFLFLIAGIPLIVIIFIIAMVVRTTKKFDDETKKMDKKKNRDSDQGH
jgi:hypothetical protein